jgi:hypothetical protein
VATTSRSTQTHKEISGHGQLLRDGRPPVAVRYYIVLSARPVLLRTPASLHEPYATQSTQWEWDEAHGFITLRDEADAAELDPHGHGILLLSDGTRCSPSLFPDNSRPRMKYRVQCPARELMGSLATAAGCCRPASLPLYDALRPRPAQAA